MISRVTNETKDAFSTIGSNQSSDSEEVEYETLTNG